MDGRRNGRARRSTWRHGPHLELLAPDEYATFGDALWFTLQMVTTVGFGDNTPTSGVGRFVASVVITESTISCPD